MLENLLVKKWFQYLVLISLLLSIVMVSDRDVRWREQIQNLNFDYYNILKPFETKGHAVIIDIDERSLAHESLGQWPWSRVKLAMLVDKLTELGAGTISFDMVFPEEDRTSPKKLLKLLDAEETSIEDIRQKLLHLPDYDQLFADSITESGYVVTGFTEGETETNVVPRKTSKFIDAKNVIDNLNDLRGVTTNLKKITRGSAGNGSFHVSADNDGIIRKAPMLFVVSKHGGEINDIYPSLSLESVRVLKRQDGYRVDPINDVYKDLDEKNFGIKGLYIGKSRVLIPTTPKGDFLVHFANPEVEKDNWYISALDVFQDKVDPEKVKGKVVLIGTSAAGLKDIRSTPLSAFRPGVEVHLNIVEQILQKRFLNRTIEATGIEAVGLFVTGLFIILITPFIGAVLLFAIVLLLIGACLSVGWYAFTEHGYLLDVLYPSLSILLLYILSSLFTYLRIEATKKRVKEAFGLYISPDFMEELTKDHDKLQLGGETKDLSVMFTDIRNFTSISETMTPEELIQLMNEFLTPMSDLVMDNRGTIDKYMGDAMMAFWNAPLDDKNHAKNACKTALAMNKALEPINEELERLSKETGRTKVYLEAGIGVNTGQASVGNMGSKQRFAYSALGDTVNLASRLEGQTKQYGVRILIGEATRNAALEFAALELDLIRVKGKQEPERIFVLLGDEEMAQSEYFKGWEEKHKNMLSAYREMNWDLANKFCSECQELSKEGMTVFYDVFAERIEQMKNDPPSPGWDGVYVATSK